MMWFALFSAILASTVQSASGNLAIKGNHPLSQTQAGELLIAEFRCASCHSGITQDPLFEKSAPNLAEVGSRISPEFLRKYIASPSSIHRGTTMPDMLASKPDSERTEIAQALTHFLVAQSNRPFASGNLEKPDVLAGKSLYHSIGCVACHGPKEAATETPLPAKTVQDDEDEQVKSAREKTTFSAVAVSLEHVSAKYSTKSLSEFLFQPLHVRSSGRMPDMKLTPSESLSIAGYLMGEQPQSTSALVPQQALVAKGKAYFQELNCAACHAIGGIVAAPPVGPMKIDEPSRGCLSKSKGPSPQFQLHDAQVQAIMSALRQKPGTDSDQVVVAKTLTSFHCIACHVRDDYGGIQEDINAYFTTSERNLGDDGRIPPPLTLLGAKLQPTWLKKVLFDGESVRPYMATRMPQYGTSNLQHFPSVIARLDVLEGTDLDIPTPESRSEKVREREKLLRAAGRELLGDKGVNCIACHNFNGKPAPINKGMDLMTSYQRLQPKWFNSFVRNPGAFRPRIVMPYSWSDGIAAHKTILDGNTDMQIEAIWYYLSLGTSAADPSGIRGISTKLSVGDQARTYRGRSRVAGFRGIAVGFPEKLNYAFNAETGTLSAIWLGDFIGVNWNGQGSGDFQPASEPITLAQDVSFVQLSDENTPWPLMPVMTKEARLNPDPLYPKNLGYQFQGYFFDETSVPTFMYQCGAIQIEDRTVATSTEDNRQLKRILQFNSPVQQVVYFRALVGEITKESETVYRSGRLRLTIPNGELQIRRLSDEPVRSELLLRLPIPQGKSSIELLYEPFEKR